MGIDDKADNKAEELKGKARRSLVMPPMTRICRPRAEPRRRKAV